MPNPWEYSYEDDSTTQTLPWEQEYHEPTAEEILSRPALPAWDQTDTGTLREPTVMERIRHSRLGDKFFGGPGDIGLLPAAEKALSFTSVPPQIAEPIERFTDPLIEKLPPVPQGIVKGGRELVLNTPIAPFGEGAVAAAALTGFGADYALHLPEQKRAYREALARGDKAEAAQIATESVLGGLMIGAGTREHLRSKPIERTTDASKIGETETVHGNVREQPVEGEGKVSVEEGGGGIFKETSQGEVSLEPVKLRDEVAAMTPDEFRDWSTKQPAGFTQTAYDLGRSAPSQEFVDSLKAKSDEIYTKAEEIMRSDTPEALETVPILVAQGQFFKEAWQFATGQGSGGEAAAKAGHVPIYSHLSTGELPLAAYKGEIPEKAVPIKVRRDDGSVYEAFRESEGDATIPPMVSKIKPSGEAGTPSRSHKPLGKGETIIEGPKTAAEYRASLEAKKKAATSLPTDSGAPAAQTSGGAPAPAASAVSNPVGTTPSLTGQPSPVAVGITPGISPAIKQFGKLAQKGLQALNRTRQAFGTIWKSRGERRDMAQLLDAADNQAVVSGQQVRKGLEVGTTKRDQNALSFIVESGFDREKLATFEPRLANNPDAQLAVRDALREWDRLEPIARRGQGDLDGQITDENWNGINTEYHGDYVPHLYDQDLWMGAGRPYVVGGGGTGISTGFKKGRVFNTLVDAIEAGYKPKSLALSELAEHRVRAGQRLINRKQWANSLRTVVDPTDGKPIVTDLIVKPRGPGQPGFEVAPKGYRVQEIIPGVRIAVHEVYVPLFKALTGESIVASSTPGKLALETVGAIKHGLLAFDTFHASRIAQKQAVLTGKVSYQKGQSLLEYADKDLNRAVTEGVITPEIAQWVRDNRATGDLALKNGLNVGRVQEALYNSMIRDLPVIGSFNKLVFEKLTRGAMLESFIHEFNRVKKALPELSDDQAARQVARDLNTYFGNLGRQGFFKSQSMRDFAQLFTLAPQWVESMARTEAKGYAQAVKGVTYDPLVHKTFMVGSLGKSMGQGLIAYFIATQLLNLATRRKPTWENDEEGHKMDAWIPSVDGKGNGFFVSPLAIPAELSHDLIRYSNKDGNSLKAAAHILSNKASSPVRAVSALTTGKAFYGDPKTDDTWGRVKKAAWSLNPTPIPLQPLERKSYPGQLQRQVTASLGVKTEPAESPVQQVAAKARRFVESEGKKPVEFEMTDDPSYSKLRSAIRADNDKEANKLLEDLLKTHNAKQVMNAMKHNVLHPFTGSKDQEHRFRASLTEKEAKLYDQAVDQRAEEYSKFLDLWFK